MKILIVGEQPNTFTLAGVLGKLGGNVTHHFRCCREALRQIRGKVCGYDYVLLEKAGQNPQEAELIRHLRRSNRDVPISSLDHCAGGDAFLPRLLAAWERSRQGKRVLNCIMTAPNDFDETPASLHSEDIVFEFAAPCRRFNHLERGSSERPCV